MPMPDSDGQHGQTNPGMDVDVVDALSEDDLSCRAPTALPCSGRHPHIDRGTDGNCPRVQLVPAAQQPRGDVSTTARSAAADLPVEARCRLVTSVLAHRSQLASRADPESAGNPGPLGFSKDWAPDTAGAMLLLKMV